MICPLLSIELTKCNLCPLFAGKWKKAMKMNPNVIWFQLITPSNIAFVISLLKNGMPSWNKKKMIFETEESQKMKAKPLFTSGEGQKRSLG